MDVASLRRYRRVRRADFVAAMVGIGGVVLFGPLPGLGIAIVTSLLAIIYRSSSPRMEVLGKIESEKAAWGRMRNHTTRRTVPGVVVVRLDAPLFWANATAIEDRLLEEVDRWPDTRALVLDLEATSQLESTSVDMLDHLHGELACSRDPALSRPGHSSGVGGARSVGVPRRRWATSTSGTASRSACGPLGGPPA